MSSTAYGYFKFLTELILAAGLFSYPLKRRKYFFLRLIFCLACSYGLSRIYGYELSRIFWYAVFRYLMLFTCVIVTLFVCFDTSVKTAMFCGISAYCVQFFTNKVYYFIEITWLSESPIGILVSVYIPVFLVGYAVFFFIFARRIRRNLTLRVERVDLLLCYIAIVAIMILLSRVIDFYVGSINFWGNLVLAVYGMLCSVFILTLQSGIFNKSALKSEMQEMEHIWAAERRQMEVSKSTIELINVKCHDMKNMLSGYSGKIASEDIKDLQELISVYDTSVKTGNATLDMLIAEKSLFIRQNKIAFTCIADGAALGFMRASDIYSLFGNALNNAIEASVAVKDEERRVISLNVKKSLGTVIIHMENFFDGELKYRDGRLVTTKNEEEGYHGFGTRSIELITEKYGGTLAARAENNIYKLDIIFIDACVGEVEDV